MSAFDAIILREGQSDLFPSSNTLTYQMLYCVVSYNELALIHFDIPFLLFGTNFLFCLVYIHVSKQCPVPTNK